MARAVVVYESMFGNTKAVATAVAEGIAESVPVDCWEVGSAGTLPDDLVLLVVGAPNHAFGLPTQDSRVEAATETEEPLVSAGLGVREWLVSVAPAAHPTVAATFDLRLHHPAFVRHIDRAARQVTAGLTMKGYRVAADSETFLVSSVRGPLALDELDHAREWGRSLGQLAVG